MIPFLIALLLPHVCALRFRLHGSPHTRKRDHSSFLDNVHNILYFINITLGEQQFSVSLDTGSSDLWVAGNILNSTDTGISAGVQYAIGGVSGDVKTAVLTLLGFIVPDQAFIQVRPSSTYPEGRGLIGLGPNVGSNIHDALKKQPKGDTVLDRIFRQDPSTPNVLTVLLSRSDDPDEQYPGAITVSDILPVYLDPNGIIGPDGQPIRRSMTKSRPLTVIFDTGFSFNQVPKTVADEIYSRIPGAKFENLTVTGPIWTLPCRAEVNTALLFGNRSFPIHPLDMNLSLKDSSGNQTCVGGFQPITTAASPGYDVILGMVFLRNAYLLINYGDFVDGAATKAPPYVQLLSVTNPTTAHVDFIITRLGGVITAPTVPMLMHTTVYPDNVVPHFADRTTRMVVLYTAIGGCVFLVSVAVTGYVLWRCKRRRHLATSSTIDKGRSCDDTTYISLPSSVEMHLLQ